MALLGLVVVAGPGAAGAAQPGAADERAGEAARDVEVLSATVSELRAVATALATDVDLRRAQAAVTAAAADAASAAHRSARRAVASNRAEAAGLRATITTLAVEVYMQPRASQLPPLLWLSPVDASRADVLTSTVTERLDAAVRQLAALTEELEEVRARSQAAQRGAAATASRAVQASTELATSLAAQERLLTALEAELERRLAEAEALAQLDATLAEQVAAEGRALAEVTRANPTAAGGTAATGDASSAVELRTVGGITVAGSIADQLAGLLVAASAAGFELGGGGFRDPAAQVALRRAHCGPSPEAVHQMPASRCSPPTARPGMSLHEQGLAVDFTWRGATITDESSDAFRWLAANAGRFGFTNLPGEPWHWSTTGH